MKSDESSKRLTAAAEIRRIEKIYGEYGARVYGFCYRLCGNASDAEDLTADVFLALCQGISRFQGRSSMKTYLFGIAVHKYRNLVAGRPFAAEPLVDETFAPIAESDRDERLVIEQAMRMLSDEQREAVVLVKVEGLKYREAAKVLGVPQGTVQSRVYDAVQRLRRICGETVEMECTRGCASPGERCAHEM